MLGTEQRESLCRMGLLLAKRFISDLQVEQALEVLTKLIPLISKADKNEYVVYRLAVELLAFEPDMSLVDKLIGGLDGDCLLLVSVVSRCCYRSYYELAMRILARLFPNHVVVEVPTTSDIFLDCYEGILKAHLNKLDKQAWRELWKYFAKCCFACNKNCRVTSFKLGTDVGCLPAEIRFEMAVQQAVAMLSGPLNYQKHMELIAEAESLAVHMGIECNYEAVYLRFIKCQAMAKKNDYKGVYPALQTALQFLEAVQQEDSRFVRRFNVVLAVAALS